MHLPNRILIPAVHALLTKPYTVGLLVGASRGSRISSVVLGLAGASAYAGLAHAQLSGVTGGEGPTAMLQQICTFILGPFGQTLAVLGIIGIGLAWMFGRVSLGLIAGVIGGIIIMFGASYLGETLTSASGTSATQ